MVHVPKLWAEPASSTEPLGLDLMLQALWLPWGGGMERGCYRSHDGKRAASLPSVRLGQVIQLLRWYPGLGGGSVSGKCWVHILANEAV